MKNLVQVLPLTLPLLVACADIKPINCNEPNAAVLDLVVSTVRTFLTDGVLKDKWLESHGFSPDQLFEDSYEAEWGCGVRKSDPDPNSNVNAETNPISDRIHLNVNSLGFRLLRDVHNESPDLFEEWSEFLEGDSLALTRTCLENEKDNIPFLLYGMHLTVEIGFHELGHVSHNELALFGHNRLENMTQAEANSIRVNDPVFQLGYYAAEQSTQFGLPVRDWGMRCLD